MQLDSSDLSTLTLHTNQHANLGPTSLNTKTRHIIITEKHNAIYIFPCKNCPDKYIGQTSKNIQTRLTEHQNAINRHGHSSLPAKHTDDNGHKFDWSQTRCLGQATTKHAREFKEAWHRLDKQTFNRHIDIPTIYLQLKRSHKYPNPSSLTFNHPQLPSLHRLMITMITRIP